MTKTLLRIQNLIFREARLDHGIRNGHYSRSKETPEFPFHQPQNRKRPFKHVGKDVIKNISSTSSNTFMKEMETLRNFSKI